MELDICNGALIKNHEMGLLDSPDGTIANATGPEPALTLCRQFYAEARRQILRMVPWTCCTWRIHLASKQFQYDTPAEYGERILFETPTGWAILKCTRAGLTGPNPLPFAEPYTHGTTEWQIIEYVYPPPLENDTIFQHAAPLPINYLQQVEVVGPNNIIEDFLLEGTTLYTDNPSPLLIYVRDAIDPDTWDPLLKETITTQLAAMLAYPLSGSRENDQMFMQAAQGLVVQALNATLREKRQGQKTTEPWMPGLFDTRKANRA